MIEISEYYTTKKGDLKFLYDEKEINNRPAWIKILDNDEQIKFLKVNTASGRFYYTSFIENYYLVEDASNEEIGIFYDEICEIYNKKMQNHIMLGNYIYDNIKEKFNSNSSILSICSGSGIEMKALLKKGYKNITLLDVSKDMINIAKNSSEFKDCKFMVSDFLKADFKKTKYDVLVCSMGIHYFNGDSLQRFLRKCKSILNKNGEIHIVNINIPRKELNKYFNEIKNDDYQIVNDENKATKVLYYIGKLKESE